MLTKKSLFFVWFERRNWMIETAFCITIIFNWFTEKDFDMKEKRKWVTKMRLYKEKKRAVSTEIAHKQLPFDTFTNRNDEESATNMIFSIRNCVQAVKLVCKIKDYQRQSINDCFDSLHNLLVHLLAVCK